MHGSPSTARAADAGDAVNRFATPLSVLALVAVTAIWGWTFVVVRDAVLAYPVMPFLSLRFLLATLVLLPVLLKGRAGLAAGILPGMVLAAGYAAQTLGLQDTTASRAGLLTGLFVVITPLLELAVFGRRPAPITLIAVGGALAGTILLASNHGLLTISSRELLGDALEVLTAVCFSVHILLLGRVAAGRNAARLALTQMLVAAVLFAAFAGAGGGYPAPAGPVWGAIAITGALASALAFWVQTFVQQRIAPSRVAIILVAEPAFATLFGFVLAGDRFSPSQGLGALMIVLALLLHETGPLLTGSPATQSVVT